jgi:hypothetical protein
MPNIDVKTLINSTDLVNLVQTMMNVRLRQMGHEFRGPCPIHGGDNPTGFCVYRSKKTGIMQWTCFTHCGGGDAIDFVMKVTPNCDFPEACRILGGEDADPVQIRMLAEQRAAVAAKELEFARARMEKAKLDLQSARRWEEYHDNLDRYNTRGLWAARGIPQEWQEYWQLGYNPEFHLWRKKTDGDGYESFWKTPTLSIPIFAPGWKPVTIRHRLLQPFEENDKYRPDKASLESHSFIADPDRNPEWDGEFVVFEGEIKAAVGFKTLDSMEYQVIGVPGIKSLECAMPLLQHAGRVFIGFDPGVEASKRAFELAKRVDAIHPNRARLMRFTGKPDDMINNGWMDKSDLHAMMRGAVTPSYF